MSDSTKTKMPHTGNKVMDIIVVLCLIVSVLGIIAFGYSGVVKLLALNIFGALPNIIYIMMYVSIIQYIINYFILEKSGSIYSMLQNYCMLTLMTTVTLPNIANYGSLLVIMIAIVILVPLMRKDLLNIKRCVIIIVTVLILVIAMTCLKLYFGCTVLEGSNPFLRMVAGFNVFHPLFVWIIFSLLYIARGYWEYNRNKEEIEEIGMDAFREEKRPEYDAYIEEISSKDKEDEDKKDKKDIKSKIKEKKAEDKQ